MILRQDLRGALALFLALSLACTPGHALVSLNDGHDHIFITGGMTVGWDSNVFANADAHSDSTVSTTLLAEYQRRAGWIGVNASVGIDSTRYNILTNENFNNPRFSLELTKQTGRTTGSFTLNAARQSRADAAVNLRSTSWNYDTGLNFRYPIVTIYTLSGQLGYSTIKYVNDTFPELATYSASFDLIRLLSTERDMMVGYRYRHGETSLNSNYDDHAVTAGLTGKLIRGINGSLRAGYQVRIPHGFIAGGKPEATFSSWTASGSGTYAVSKRMSFTGTLAKDFATTANDTSVDTTTAALDLQFAYSSHWILTGSVSGGDSRFIGDTGRVLLANLTLGPQRHDDFVTANASINYSLNQHLKIAATYAWFKNWSNQSAAVFVRSSYNLNLSSRW